MIKNMNIRFRMLIIVICGAMGVLATAAFGLYNLNYELIEDRKLKTLNLVETATSIVSHYHEQFKAGTISEDEAKMAAMTTIKALRYDIEKDKDGKETGNYFWINDMAPVMIMHPIKPALDGKNVGAVKDPNGTLLFIEMVNVVKADGAGFVPYMWPRPGYDDPHQSYPMSKALPLGAGLLAAAFTLPTSMKFSCRNLLSFWSLPS